MKKVHVWRKGEGKLAVAFFTALFKEKPYINVCRKRGEMVMNTMGGGGRNGGTGDEKNVRGSFALSREEGKPVPRVGEKREPRGRRGPSLSID